MKDRFLFVADVLSTAQSDPNVSHLVFKGMANHHEADASFIFYRAPLCTFLMGGDRPTPMHVHLRKSKTANLMFSLSNTVRFDGLRKEFSSGDLGVCEDKFKSLFRDAIEHSGVQFAEIIIYNAVDGVLQRCVPATYVVARPAPMFANSSTWANTGVKCMALGK